MERKWGKEKQEMVPGSWVHLVLLSPHWLIGGSLTDSRRRKGGQVPSTRKICLWCSREVMLMTVERIFSCVAPNNGITFTRRCFWLSFPVLYLGSWQKYVSFFFANLSIVHHWDEWILGFDLNCINCTRLCVLYYLIVIWTWGQKLWPCGSKYCINA